MTHMHNNAGEDYTGLIGKDGDKLVLTPAMQEATVVASLQAFVHTVASGSADHAIQAFSGSTDLPELTKDVFNTTLQTPNFDLGWQEAFKGVPLRKGELSWEIATMNDPAEFVLTPEGAKCYMGSVSGEKVSAGIQKYSKGLELTWEIMEGRKLSAFIEKLEGTRAKLYGLWATIHYGLLATAAANNQLAWQVTTSTTVISQDIATLNEGAYQLTSGVKDSGYGDTANAELLLYISPKFKARMKAALAVSLDALAAGTKEAVVVNWPIKVIYTFNSQIATNTGVLVLPKNKIQNAVYLQELVLKNKSYESLSESRTYWTAFGAIVADNSQCYELSFA